MSQDREEALGAYKELVRQHWNWLGETGRRTKKEREDKGLDYQGQADWLPEDKRSFFNWVKRLSDTQKSLGLSPEEVKQIRHEVIPEMP